MGIVSNHMLLRTCMIILPALLLGSCGPARVNFNEYSAEPNHATQGTTQNLMPFGQITPPNYAMPNVPSENKPDWFGFTDIDFPRPYPYLISAAPYYCDPTRYPPNIVLSVYSCMPYIPQIMQIGFPRSYRPGFN